MFFTTSASVFRISVRILAWKLLRTDLERELYLVLKENQIPKRKHRRVPLTEWDRRLYISLADGAKRLLRRAVIVTPETVLSWHRRLAAWKWNHGKQGRVGRPPVNDEIRNTVLAMKRANPRWGAQGIMGELRKLGLKSCKATVAKILREAGLGPKSRRRGQSWKDFMTSHGRRVLACDFFSVDTIFMKSVEVFFIIDVTTREIVSLAVTKQWNAEYLKNYLRSVFSFADQAPSVLIADRDLVYGKWLKPFLHESYGIEVRHTPPRTPIFNCYAERMVRTFCEEVTDRLLIFNEDDLSSALREYVDYYNGVRTHSSLDFDAPKRRFVFSPKEPRTRVVQTKLVSGLVTDFSLAA